MGTQLTHLVTGAAGFIGSHLVDALLGQGDRVIGIDNLILGRRANLAAALASPHFAFKQLNVNDTNACRDYLKTELRAEAVQTAWHLAANSDIQAGVTNPDVDLEQTFLTTYHTLKLLQGLAIPEIVFASSSAIYGRLEGALSEDTGPLLPISSYGAMKLASEGVISAAVERFLQRAWIFRFPNVVGSRATHGVIYDFLGKLRRDPDELEVLGDGTQQKPYLHVSELVGAMLFLHEKSREHMNIFNISPEGNGTTVRHIAEATVRAAAKQAKIRYTGGSSGWVGDVPKFKYSIEKLKSAGWAPRLSSDQAVELAIRENLRP